MCIKLGSLFCQSAKIVLQLAITTRRVPARMPLLSSQLCQQPHSSLALRKFSFTSGEDGINIALADEDNDILESWKEQALVRGEQHVFLIQPVQDGVGDEMSHKLRLEESIALLESIPGWTVADKVVLPIPNNDANILLHERTLANLAAQVLETKAVTSLFVSIDMLTAEQKQIFSQVTNLENIYDRYTLVLQIFRLRAKTKQAKLQVDLAAIPYIQATMLAEHSKYNNKERQGYGGSGESYKELVLRQFQKKEKRIKQKLLTLKKHRNEIRHSRRRTAIPIVAVVGYTNAGKTSLIKALTKSDKLEPRDQLFATLDVTAHGAYLPNNLRYILIDTVGFLSDLPHSLIDAFSATMEDMLEADLLIHVRDVSHPDRKNQLKNVLKVLSELNVNPQLLSSIVEVRNKMDRVLKTPEGSDPAQVYDEAIRPRIRYTSPVPSDRRQKSPLLPSVVCHASATKDFGIENLRLQVQEQLMVVTGRREVELVVPANGGHLNWLQERCAVIATNADGDYHLRLRVVVTDWQLEKLKSNFQDVVVTEGDTCPKSDDKW